MKLKAGMLQIDVSMETYEQNIETRAMSIVNINILSNYL